MKSQRLTKSWSWSISFWVLIVCSEPSGSAVSLLGTAQHGHSKAAQGSPGRSARRGSSSRVPQALTRGMDGQEDRKYRAHLCPFPSSYVLSQPSRRSDVSLVG